MPQENVTFSQLFDQALSAQQQKNSDEALQLYQQALDKGQGMVTPPQASVVYHNMSTLAYEKSDFLHAYVWSKKSLALDSGNHLAKQAFEQYAKKYEVPSIARQISTTQNLNLVLERVSIDLLFVVCLILFFTTLHLFYKNLITKRKNQINLVIQTGFAWKPLVSLIVLFIFITLTGLRFSLEQRTLAILMDKTGIQTAAGEDKPVIFEAPSGLEVEVLQFSAPYAQVRYPGAFSGWVPLKNLEVLKLSQASQ